LWVIVALACIIFLFILFLCIPIEFKLSARINENPSCNVRIFWLFGLVNQELRRKETNKKKDSPQKKEPKTEGKSRVNASFFYAIIKTRGLCKQLRLLMKRVIKSLKIKKLLLHLNLGFEDPSDTALLYALTGPVNYLLNNPPYDIRINPIFDGDLYFDANLDVMVRIIPVFPMMGFLGFVFSLPVFNIIKLLAVRRWKRE
jgi:hypothetical protein